jgi:predicted phosphodiesterase
MPPRHVGTIEEESMKGRVNVGPNGGDFADVTVEAPILDGDWSRIFTIFRLDPDEFEVVDDTVRMSTWQQSKRLEDGQRDTVQLYSYSAKFIRKALKRDISALIREAKRGMHKGRPTSLAKAASEQGFVVALGDLQLGKMDGDGVDGTVSRFLSTTVDAIARYKRIAKGAPVYLIHLGDCIEGYVSQGGDNAKRTTLTTTEQVDLYQDLLLNQVKAFAKVAPSLTVVGIPGNHDEAHRPLHTYTDSWALQAVSSVKRAMDFAGGYDHVTTVTPERDELTVTLDVCGTRVGMAHGHQWRPGQATTWWAKQSHGRQPVGDADLLLSAHLHHLRVEHTGRDKTWLQVPALESGSQWWKHKTGEWGQPGVVTMLVGGGSWRSLEVLS